MLTQLSQNYGIPKGRQLVKQTISKCIVCRKVVGPPFCSVTTPPLPVVTGSQPFQSKRFKAGYEELNYTNTWDYFIAGRWWMTRKSVHPLATDVFSKLYQIFTLSPWVASFIVSLLVGSPIASGKRVKKVIVASSWILNSHNGFVSLIGHVALCCCKSFVFYEL